MKRSIEPRSARWIITGRVLGVVLALVGELEALGHLEVELAGSQLPRAPESVGDVEVDLRPVEGSVARVEHRSRGPGSRGRSRGRLGLVPLLLAADGLLRARRELDPDVVEAEARIELVDALADRVDLVGDLLERAVDVGVVLGERANPQQAVEHALALVSVDGRRTRPAAAEAPDRSGEPSRTSGRRRGSSSASARSAGRRTRRSTCSSR